MDNTSQTSKLGPRIDRVVTIHNAIRQYITEKQLTFFQEPEWIIPKEYHKRRLGQWLHRIFSFNETTGLLSNIFPFNVPVTLAVMLAFSVEPSLLLVYFNFSLMVQHPERFVLLIFVSALLCLALLFSAIGTYWSFFELAINRCLSKSARWLLFVIVEPETRRITS